MIKLMGKTIRIDWFLVGIITAGFALRVLGVINITLRGDLAYNWQVAESIVTTGQIPLLSSAASINSDLKFGPAFYYVFAFLFSITGGSYQWAIVIFSLFNVFSIWLLFKACKEIIDKKAAYLITGLYAISKYSVEFGNYPWNAYFEPSILIAIFYLLTTGLEKHCQRLLAGFLSGLLFHFHPSAWLLFPVLVYGIIVFLRKDSFGKWILILTGFVIAMTPYLLGEIKANNLTGVKAITQIFFESKSLTAGKELCNFKEWLTYHGHGESCFYYIRNPLFFLRLFSYSLFGTMSIISLPLIIVLLAFFAIIVKIPYKNFFVLWLLIPFPAYLLYSRNIYLHYFLIYMPLPYIVVVSSLLHLERQYRSGKYISRAITAMLVAVNLYGNWQLLTSIR